MRSDQEPAIVRLKKAVKREFSEDMTCEEAPIGESRSLGGSAHTDSDLARTNTNAQGCIGK